MKKDRRYKKSRKRIIKGNNCKNQIRKSRYTRELQ